MALGQLLDGLTRQQVENQLRLAWAAQQRAELVGDSTTAGKRAEEIDELLERLLLLLGQR